MAFNDYLTLMVQKQASDLFISVGVPPTVKIDGRIYPLSKESLSEEDTRDLAFSIMNEEQRREFEATKECNFAIFPKKIGRFRVNVFVQKFSVSMVLRRIHMTIPTFRELRLPRAIEKLSLTTRGLIILVGGTGTGKTTTQASMLGYRNEHSSGHIITIEDPIEYIHEHNNCIVSQREVGVDTDSFDIALVNAMRQAPDVIQIGEIRTRNTMDNAIVFAETGHLCIATLHANNTYQALDRIVNFFPEERRGQLLMDLSMNLKGLVSQRLIPLKKGKGRVPAVEIMINSPLIADLILKGETHEIRDIIARSNEAGMQTFDQSLFNLYEAGLISYDDAIRNAESENDLRLNIKLNSKGAKQQELGESLRHATY